jgi:hypothetical protein
MENSTPKILVQRFSKGLESTLGVIYLDNRFMGFILEDEFRTKKVFKKTRIPAGSYKLGIREADSPLTLNYRSKFKWFDYHLHIKGVPNFKYIYIHIGQSDDQTAGCLLIGGTARENVRNDGYLWRSAESYEILYKNVRPLIEKYGDIDIEIRDENEVLK